MRFAGLISGGKDSTLSIILSILEGHELVAFGNLHPEASHESDELDSYMFQTVGHTLIDNYANAIGSVPLVRRPLVGRSVATGETYDEPCVDDEVEDLYRLLAELKTRFRIEAVSTGAILSDYQRIRVENVCSRLGLTSLAYLWRQDQSELLRQMAHCRIESVLCKVACLGLDKSHLGQPVSAITEHLNKLHRRYGVNVCGEGGEYETVTLDCPLFSSRIEITESNIIEINADAVSSVAHLHIGRTTLHPKSGVGTERSFRARLGQFADELRHDSGEELAPRDEGKKRCECGDAYIVPKACHLGFRSLELEDVRIALICATHDPNFDFESSVRGALQRITSHLLVAPFTHILSVQLSVADMSDFARINSVYKEFFAHQPPTRVCVESHLSPSSCILHMSAVAARLAPLKSMHVQSLSYWAPANIGPYSQAKKTKTSTLVSGQIGMVPANLCLSKGVESQTRLALRHVSRVLAAMGLDVDGEQISAENWLLVVYIVHRYDIAIVSAELENHFQEKPTLPISYVRMPYLPKSALVELEVRCLSSAANPLSETMTVACDEHVIRCDVHLVRSCAQPRLISDKPKLFLMYNPAYPSLTQTPTPGGQLNPPPTRVDQCLAYCLSVCARLLLRGRGLLCTCGLVRVFYRASQFHPPDENGWTSDLVEGTIFHFIPACGLQTSKRFLTLVSS